MHGQEVLENDFERLRAAHSVEQASSQMEVLYCSDDCLSRTLYPT